LASLITGELDAKEVAETLEQERGFEEKIARALESNLLYKDGNG
jgi:hypothetical protein